MGWATKNPWTKAKLYAHFVPNILRLTAHPVAPPTTTDSCIIRCLEEKKPLRTGVEPLSWLYDSPRPKPPPPRHLAQAEL